MLAPRCLSVGVAGCSGGPERRQQAERSGTEAKRTERRAGCAALACRCCLSAQSMRSPFSLCIRAWNQTVAAPPLHPQRATRPTSHHAAPADEPHQRAAPSAQLGPLERNRTGTRRCIASWTLDNDTAAASATSGCRCRARGCTLQPDERPPRSGVDQSAPCHHADPAASPAADSAVGPYRFLLKRTRAAVCRRLPAARAPSAVQLRPPSHCTRAQVASRWRHCVLLQCACCGSTDICPSPGSGCCGCHCGRIERRRCSCGRALFFCCRIHSRCCSAQPAVSSHSLLLPSLSAAGARRQTRRHVAAAAALPLESGSGRRAGHTHRPQTRGRHGGRSVRHARSRVSADRTESNARVEEAEI